MLFLTEDQLLGLDQNELVLRREKLAAGLELAQHSYQTARTFPRRNSAATVIHRAEGEIRKVSMLLNQLEAEKGLEAA